MNCSATTRCSNPKISKWEDEFSVLIVFKRLLKMKIQLQNEQTFINVVKIQIFTLVIYMMFV